MYNASIHVAIEAVGSLNMCFKTSRTAYLCYSLSLSLVVCLSLLVLSVLLSHKVKEVAQELLPHFGIGTAQWSECATRTLMTTATYSGNHVF